MAAYFAYGSNLDWHNWSVFCGRHAADPHCLKPITSAVLPDVELVFNYRSVLREGGALNLRPHKGQVVHGVLFDVNERGWEVLDLKESVAIGCYERTASVALMRNGETMPVVTYVVTPARTEGFVAPSDEYTKIVLRGLSAHGLGAAQYEKSAQGVRTDPEVDGVFVYGTLMRDESRFSAIKQHSPLQTLPGRIRGSLHETDTDYPMLDLEASLGDRIAYGGKSANSDPKGNGEFVHGEFVRFSDMVSVLDTLDEIEAFSGYGNQHNEYVRTLAEVDTDEGSPRHAWTYVAADRAALGNLIESGCWRTFRGVRGPRSTTEVTN
jgi:gamma-glutamylcyclotransferase (GGCT)/AIG2-like uncharacterized protein YtfP